MKNWKTTVAGILAGTLIILQQAITSLQSGASIQWLQVVLGFVVMAIGVVAKDFDTTGIGKSATKIVGVLLVCCLAFTATACAHVAMVAATTSSGHVYEYCLEVTQVVGTDTLFCGSLTQAQAAQQEQKKLHPENTYSIVPAGPVAK